MQKLKYKLNYWKRKLALAIGLCPKCWQRVNFTSAGRPICPNCGH
jgi:predicted amidophosphoribosyltransferase